MELAFILFCTALAGALVGWIAGLVAMGGDR